MTRFRQTFPALALSLGAATLVAPGTARAGGFLTARFGAEQGHVTTDHPSATYYNPAGLAMRGGTRVVIEGTFGYRTAEYDRPEAAIDNVQEPGDMASGTPQDAVSANAGTATLSNTVAAPFAAVTTDFGVPNLGVGLSLSVPFGGQAAWAKNQEYVNNLEHPGAQDGVQRWTTIEGTIRALYVTVAGAYYIPAARLSLGVGLNLVSQEVSVLRARNASSTDDLVTGTGTLLEGRSLVDVTGNSFSLGVGAIWAPTPSLRLGVSYQSKPGFGKTAQSGKLTNKFGDDATTVSDIEFEQTLPDVLRVGFSYFVDDKLTLRGQVDFQRWSAFDRQCVLDAGDENRACVIGPDGESGAGASGIIANLERDFEDSFGIRAGMSYLVTPKIGIDVGASYDGSAVPDQSLDASFIDMGKIVAVVGARFALGSTFTLAAHWTQVIYFERTTEAYEPLMAPSRVPNSFGTYRQSVGIAQIGVEAAF